MSVNLKRMQKTPLISNEEHKNKESTDQYSEHNIFYIKDSEKSINDSHHGRTVNLVISIGFTQIFLRTNFLLSIFLSFQKKQ